MPRGVSYYCDVCGNKCYRRGKKMQEQEHHFCSMACKSAFHGPKRVTCASCGKEFDKKQAEQRSRQTHFCSIDCYRDWQRQNMVARACIVCGVDFIPKRYRGGSQACCSYKCRGVLMKGDKNPSWQGGQSSYRGPDWTRIRIEVFERDGYKCQHCGSGAFLNAHHLTPYRLTQDNSLDNLQTLCDKCHGLADREYVRSVCYPVQTTLETAPVSRL